MELADLSPTIGSPQSAARRATRPFVFMLACSAVIVIGLLTIGEYLTRDMGLDRVLFGQKLSATGMSFPGRPSPHTAFNFLLIGFALLLMRMRTVRAGT